MICQKLYFVWYTGPVVLLQGGPNRRSPIKSHCNTMLLYAKQALSLCHYRYIGIGTYKWNSTRRPALGTNDVKTEVLQATLNPFMHLQVIQMEATDLVKSMIHL